MTRGQCTPLRVAIGTGGIPSGAYHGEIRITSNDPDEPLTVIPVQVIVPSIFDIGGPQPDFADFREAVAYLSTHGVFEPTVFDAYPGTYDSVSIPQIAGASATKTITFRGVDTPPLIAGPLGPMLKLDGSDHVIFDRINFQVQGYDTTSDYPYTVWLTNGADSNVIRNAHVTGATLNDASCYGVYVDGIDNDGNLFERDTVLNSHDAIRLGSGTTSCAGNEVRECCIPECVWGINVWRQTAKIHDNDIQPGFAGAIVGVFGVYSPSQAVGDTVSVCNNRIHNFRGGSGAVGVVVSSGTSGAIRLFNNFIYDWQITGGVVYGVEVSAPYHVECHFNSIRINDVATSTNIAAVYLANASAQLSLSNNILEVDEPTSLCWSISRSGGTLTSNYNCFYGTGAAYRVGYSYWNNYWTLSDWRTATGLDSQSRQGEPVFLGATDLHIDPFGSFVDSAGITLSEITTDIDGNLRAGVPDIGADEYVANHGRVDDLVIRVNWDANGVDLAWGSVAGANSYRIYRTSAGGTWSIYPSILVATTTDTSYTHSEILSTAAHLIYSVAASASAP
jgi:hypothetical protein